MAISFARQYPLRWLWPAPYHYRQKHPIGKPGDNPANARRRFRTCPKLSPGSSLCTRRKTSPLASLVGSHQPRPAWLMMRISPLPRRYFRLSFVLSFRSSFQHGGFAPAPQRNAPYRAIPRFRGRVGSYPLLAFERRSWAVWPWACFRPCPAPKPRDRRAARARGTRGSLRRTLVARPALAVAIPAPLLLRRSWAKPARTGIRPRSRDDRGPNNADTCKRFPSVTNGARFLQYRERYPSNRNSSAVGDNLKAGTTPLRSVSLPRPSGGSPLTVPGVNLGHEDGSE